MFVNICHILNEISPGCLLGYAWAEDKEHCEEYGRMLQADPRTVSMKAKKRGLPQVIIQLFLLNYPLSL